MAHTLAAINIVLGLIGFFWMLIRTTRRRSEYPTEVLMLLYAALALFFGLLTTSVAVFIGPTDPFNISIIFAVKVFVLIMLWRTRHTKWRTGTRQIDGNPNADQNRDVP